MHAVEAYRRLAGLGARPAAEREMWIGDDAAVVGGPAGPLVLATDAVVGGVHADLALVGLERPRLEGADRRGERHRGHGRPAPIHALVTSAVPPGTDLDALAAGWPRRRPAWGCPVVGGDLSTRRPGRGRRWR